jgi:intracellular septation protein
MEKPRRQTSTRSILLGGVLPLIAYTVIEEYYGVKWGLLAGMVLGVGEIISEKIQFGQVEKITWAGNGLLFGMGLISLFTGEGIWFKLQPAIMETVMAVLLIGSVIFKHPFLVVMAEKQGTFEKFPEPAREQVKAAFSGLTFRMGIFLLLHAVLATWAAFYWSTRAWALLKGVGFTGSMFVYMIIEVLLIRKSLRAERSNPVK